MIRVGLFIVGLIVSGVCYSQTLNVQAGTSFSKLDWELRGIKFEEFLPQKLTGFVVLAGIDYAEKPYFNLSTNLGVIRKGGKGKLILIDQNGEPTGETILTKATLDYLTINTLIEGKYPIKRFIPFIGLGPRVDFLINASKEFDGLVAINELNKTALGLIMGGGVKYDLEKFQVGLRADYYLEFLKVAEWKIEQTAVEGEIRTSVFTVNITVGYKL